MNGSEGEEEDKVLFAFQKLKIKNTILNNISVYPVEQLRLASQLLDFLKENPVEVVLLGLVRYRKIWPKRNV